MRASGNSLRRTACAFALSYGGLIVPVAAAAPLLRSAEVTIRIPSPTVCDVSMTLVIDAATAIDHRLESPPGTDVDAVRIQAARETGKPLMVGRTRSLMIAPNQGAYTLSYRVRQPETRMHRCPLWLPAVPADGVSRAVSLHVEVPPGTSTGNTMPRFTWNGSAGTATLAHLPAFVLIPYSAVGEPAGWDLSTAMDVAAVSVFVGASVIWVWRRRRSK
jgi:hypothetical protein